MTKGWPSSSLIPSSLSGMAAVLLAALLWIAATGLAEAKGSTAPPPPPTLDDVLSAFPNGMTDTQLDAVLGVMSDSALREALRKRLLDEMAARRAAAAKPESDILKIYAARLKPSPPPMPPCRTVWMWFSRADWTVRRWTARSAGSARSRSF